LDPNVENPEDRDARQFRHYPLAPWVLKQRARLVVAALTLLRAHALAGSPAEGVTPWASFEPWTAKIASAIVWAGGPNVLDARPKGEAANPEQEEVRELEAAWPRGEGGRHLALSTRELLNRAKEPIEGMPTIPHDGPPTHAKHPGLWDALEALAPQERFGDRAKKLGVILRKRQGRVVGTVKLSGWTDSHTKTKVWGFVALKQCG
jgi:hypothetical protein